MGVVLPADEASAASVAQVAEKPGCKRKLVSVQGGMDRASISYNADGQTMFGNPFYTKDYWVDETQANSTTPLDQYEPVFALIVTPVLAGSTVQCVVTCKIEYHIQFFDLRVSRQLAKDGTQVKIRQTNSDFDRIEEETPCQDLISQGTDVEERMLDSSAETYTRKQSENRKYRKPYNKGSETEKDSFNKKGDYAKTKQIKGGVSSHITASRQAVQLHGDKD